MKKYFQFSLKALLGFILLFGSCLGAYRYGYNIGHEEDQQSIANKFRWFLDDDSNGQWMKGYTQTGDPVEYIRQEKRA